MPHARAPARRSSTPGIMQPSHEGMHASGGSSWLASFTLVDPDADSALGSMQDDILELSRRVVQGFMLRVRKWPMYIAFRLWRSAARSRGRFQELAHARRDAELRARAFLAMRAHAAYELHLRAQR